MEMIWALIGGFFIMLVGVLVWHEPIISSVEFIELVILIRLIFDVWDRED